MEIEGRKKYRKKERRKEMRGRSKKERKKKKEAKKIEPKRQAAEWANRAREFQSKQQERERQRERKSDRGREKDDRERERGRAEEEGGRRWEILVRPSEDYETLEEQEEHGREHETQEPRCLPDYVGTLLFPVQVLSKSVGALPLPSFLSLSFPGLGESLHRERKERGDRGGDGRRRAEKKDAFDEARTHVVFSSLWGTGRRRRGGGGGGPGRGRARTFVSFLQLKKKLLVVHMRKNNSMKDLGHHQLIRARRRKPTRTTPTR